jgi:CRISPR-associated endonuclease Cas1
MSKLGIWIHPVESRVLNYEAGDPIHLGITFPKNHALEVFNSFVGFNSLRVENGKLRPGETIVLEKAVCRISGETVFQSSGENSFTTQCNTVDGRGESPLSALPFLDLSLLKPEIDALTRLDFFSLLLWSPLRLARPQKKDQPKGHKHCDAEFFLESPDDGRIALDHFMDRIGISIPGAGAPTKLRITNGELLWLDNNYGKYDTPMGGVTGIIRVDGRAAWEEAATLVVGQYIGLGKNRAFGLGFFVIPEIGPDRRIKALSRGRSLLDRAISAAALQKARDRVPNSSPGPDGLTLGDIKKAGSRYLEKLRASVLSGAYRQGPFTRYQMSKSEGGFRGISVQNFTDKIVQRALADFVSPIVEGILSRSAFAFRRGHNRKGAAEAVKDARSEGYDTGVKADISAYFDSVDISRMDLKLRSLMPFDPLPDRIAAWLAGLQAVGVSGLPQGSPLSPVLSNLYLDRFDRQMENIGARLIRFCDDFVALFKDCVNYESALEHIRNKLTLLGLVLKEEKTIEVKVGEPVKFLGFSITADKITLSPKDKEEPEEAQWLPVFRDEWIEGHPVYLSSICRGAYSSGPHLIIKDENELDEKINWSRISRIVVVGRSHFSGGVVYRAVKEQIPVSFIDIMGRSQGHLYPATDQMEDLRQLQRKKSKDSVFCLQIAREIISAHIHNRHVVLRRKLKTVPELKDMATKALNAESIEQLRGIEGSAARMFYTQLSDIVQPFDFKGRVYRPPDGPVNTMLSFGYTLLYNRIASVLRDKGFEPRRGFYHIGRGMHYALASDMLEVLRHVAERVVFALVGRKEIQPNDFAATSRNGLQTCRLLGPGFRKFVRRFEHTMSKRSSYLGGKEMSLNEYLYEMADSMRRTLKLDIPFEVLRID